MNRDRVFGLSLALSLVMLSQTAHAGDVRYYLTFADQATASRNNANVGDAAYSTIAIGAIGAKSRFSLNVKSTAATTQYTATSVFVGFDQGNAPAGLNFATRTDAINAGLSKAISLGEVFENLGTGYSGLVGQSHTEGQVNLEPIASAAFSGVDSNTDVVRSIGLWQGFGFGVGNNLMLANSSSIRLLDFEIENKSVAGDEVFGDIASENGLTINAVYDAKARTSRFAYGNTRSGQPDGTVKYRLTSAVPEPATFVAVATGMLTLLKRRRK
ncbi:MAG: PEP-CTERM sorting domain-containing protein [Armatimonadetes bacterium]|nr:PEP-CTERM sorting domain-containing protein [Armatimonadota bacterium]